MAGVYGSAASINDPLCDCHCLAIVRLEMDNGDILRLSTTMRTDIETIPRAIEYLGRALRLERLNPQPLDYETIPQEDYRLFLTTD